MKNLCYIIFIFFACNIYSQEKKQAPQNFSESKVIFAGKLKGYETVIKPGRELLIADFQMIIIMKGERRFNLLAIMEKADTLDFQKEYLVYAIKNKERDLEGKRIGYIYFDVTRIVELKEDEDNMEISTLIKYVRKKFFRGIKKPLPEYRLNCHCGV